VREWDIRDRKVKNLAQRSPSIFYVEEMESGGWDDTSEVSCVVVEMFWRGSMLETLVNKQKEEMGW